MENRNTIALPGDALGKSSVLKHQVKLKSGTHPIYIPAYRLPHSQFATVEKLINEMLTQEVIEPNDSPWNFLPILEPKPDDTVRPAIDYRQLNTPSQIDYHYR